MQSAASLGGKAAALACARVPAFRERRAAPVHERVVRQRLASYDAARAIVEQEQEARVREQRSRHQVRPEQPCAPLHALVRRAKDQLVAVPRHPGAGPGPSLDDGAAALPSSNECSAALFGGLPICARATPGAARLRRACAADGTRRSASPAATKARRNTCVVYRKGVRQTTDSELGVRERVLDTIDPDSLVRRVSPGLAVQPRHVLRPLCVDRDEIPRTALNTGLPELPLVRRRAVVQADVVVIEEAGCRSTGEPITSIDSRRGAR